MLAVHWGRGGIDVRESISMKCWVNEPYAWQQAVPVGWIMATHGSPHPNQDLHTCPSVDAIKVSLKPTCFFVGYRPCREALTLNECLPSYLQFLPNLYRVIRRHGSVICLKS